MRPISMVKWTNKYGQPKPHSLVVVVLKATPHLWTARAYQLMWQGG
jgi:hypothetical protein